MLTVLEVLKRTTEYLAQRGVERPRLEAEHLLAHVLGVGRLELYLGHDRPLAEPVLERLRPLVRRRGQREPLQHVVGDVEFAGVRLKVDRRALVPRPETEVLVAKVVERVCGGGAVEVLDLGTGSGAIAVAVAVALPAVRVTAVDRSVEALSLAAENAEAAGVAGRVRFVESDWYLALEPAARWSVVVSNPPYLSEDEWTSAAPEVRDHDPKGALVAAEGGVADLVRLVRESVTRLERGGWLFLETGEGHAERLGAEARAAGYEAWEAAEDLAGRPRYFVARAPV